MCAMAVVMLVGCRSSSETAPSPTGSAGSAGSAGFPTTSSVLSCKNVAEHLAAVAIADTDKPGIHFVGPEAGPIILRAVSSRCDQDRWSEDAKSCYLAMKTTNDWKPCEAKLTGEQLTKIQTEMGAAKEVGQVDSGSGAVDQTTAPAIDRSAPWIERAEKVLPVLLDGKNGTIAATSILTITHSQGNKPSLKTYRDPADGRPNLPPHFHQLGRLRRSGREGRSDGLHDGSHLGIQRTGARLSEGHRGQQRLGARGRSAA